jgi:hypothetical protein
MSKRRGKEYATSATILYPCERPCTANFVTNARPYYNIIMFRSPGFRGRGSFIDRGKVIFLLHGNCLLSFEFFFSFHAKDLF